MAAAMRARRRLRRAALRSLTTILEQASRRGSQSVWDTDGGGDEERREVRAKGSGNGRMGSSRRAHRDRDQIREEHKLLYRITDLPAMPSLQ